MVFLNHHHHLPSVVQITTLPTFIDQWKSITFNWFVLNMVKGQCLQLRHHSLLFCNFEWFNIKAATLHHPIIWKEVDEQLAKDANEPLTGDVVFYSNILLFLNTLVIHDPYSVLSSLITICTYLLLRFLLSYRYANLLNKVIMFFLFI